MLQLDGNHRRNDPILTHFALQKKRAPVPSMLCTGHTCATLSAMTLKQKLVVGILALANLAVIATLITVVIRPVGSSASHPPRTPVTATISMASFDRYAAGEAAAARDCAWQATRLMAYTGLGGTAIWAPNGALRFEIARPLASGEPPDEAAQAVWTAFDIALALQKGKRCAGFSEVSVAIIAQGETGQAEFGARVSASDLVAYGAGSINEETLISRVAYARSRRSVR
jgi:hypothetical protein